MSEYPRPERPLPARPYLFDRVVAIIFACLTVLSKILWLNTFLRRPDTVPIVTRWWWFYIFDLLFFALYGVVFYAMARSRFWAFVTAAILALMSVIGDLATGYLIYAGFAFVLFAYGIARLFNMLGPRPLHRYDLV